MDAEKTVKAPNRHPMKERAKLRILPTQPIETETSKLSDEKQQKQINAEFAMISVKRLLGDTLVNIKILTEQINALNEVRQAETYQAIGKLAKAVETLEFGSDKIPLGGLVEELEKFNLATMLEMKSQANQTAIDKAAAAAAAVNISSENDKSDD